MNAAYQPSNLDAVARYAFGKAPLLGVPLVFRDGTRHTAVVPREGLRAAVEAGRFHGARVSYDTEAKALIFKAKRCFYSLRDLWPDKDPSSCLRETLESWARAQRQRRNGLSGSKADRKRRALEQGIGKLEKRLWYRWPGDPPQNPVLNKGKAAYDFERPWWAKNRETYPLRVKVGLLGLKKWTHWADLHAALAAIGAKLRGMEDVPKNGRRRRRVGPKLKLDTITPATLVSACELCPHREDTKTQWWSESREWYVEARTRWRESKRERDALVRRLAELRELRDMPEALAASDIGMPEGVDVEVQTVAQ